jgi:hypothetical protein
VSVDCVEGVRGDVGVEVRFVAYEDCMSIPRVLRERHTLVLRRALLSSSKEAIIALQLIPRLRAHRHDDLPRVDEAGRGQCSGR